MNLTCPRCQAPNETDARFCKFCGTAFNVKPIRRNSISAPIIIIIAVLAVCGFCGIFGLVDKKSEVAQTSSSSVKQLSSADTTDTKTLPSPSAEPKTAVKKSVAGKEATVISENVNLRETPSSGGAIIQTVPRGAAVEIVRQQGAWFYVNTDGRGGWLHGNTIQLGENQSAQSPTVPEQNAPQNAPGQSYQPPKPVRRPVPERAINNADATARCRDGSLSFSAHRRGTCSHHGGVAEWY